MSLLDFDAPQLWQLVLGHGDPGGSMARGARASICHRCDAHRIHGLDADWAALPAMADAEPLSALGEVQATIQGLRTYDLTRHGAGFQLDGRDHTHVKGRPAGSGRVDVLVEHLCGAAFDRAPPVLVLRRPPTSSVPPF